MDIKIVIAVNKNDVWFCRICVASIRYYYSDVEIFLLKDELNGKFSTKEIERNWQVGIIEFSVKEFGWSAAKIHFYSDDRFSNQKFLVIDCDIVFIGKLLDQQFLRDFQSDVIVSEEKHLNFESDWFNNTYYDFKKVRAFDPGFVYPGYTFNCGQLFCRGNFLSKKSLSPYFNFAGMPAWTRTDIFPLVDQSLFNYLLPALAEKGLLKIGRENYMLWSESEEVKRNISLPDVKRGDRYPYLVHWAGALRTPLINKMTRPDILYFFEDHYYSKIKAGKLIRVIKKIKPFSISILRNLKRRLQN